MRPNSCGRSSVVLGASEKDKNTVSPKIWHEAVAKLSEALTKGDAKPTVDSKRAEAITCETIL
jgi:hypothetical protein